MNTSNPLVSIIIPVYNKEKYITFTLQSVENQSYENWECILIDDGSTDQSFIAVEKFVRASLSPHKYKIVRQVNKGQSETRNTGLRIAIGKYIAFLDGDDLWHPEKLKLQVGKMELDNTLGAIFCNYFIFKDEYPSRFLRLIRFKNVDNMIKNWSNMTGFGGGLESAALIRKRVLNNCEGFNVALSTSAGLELAYRLWVNSKIETIAEPLMLYRLSKGQWHRNLQELKHNVDLFVGIHNLSFEDRNLIDAYFALHKVNIKESSLMGYIRLTLNKCRLRVIFLNRNIVAVLLGLVKKEKFWFVHNMTK